MDRARLPRQPPSDPDDRFSPDAPTIAGYEPRVLAIDDEPRILDFVERGLGRMGYRVDTERDSREGLRRALTDPYELVILDLLMPGMDGITVLRRLKEGKPLQPVIVLSAMSDTRSTVTCLDAGADDYLTKPFSFDELVARVHARIRGTTKPPGSSLIAGAIFLDPATGEANVGSRRIRLTRRESLLLRELMSNVGRTVRREQLLSAVWADEFNPHSNVVDVYVRHLRAKLGPARIKTVHGIGYRIEGTAAQSVAPEPRSNV
jgi:two-component system copper resistance phosphate regulon response regulator CusR